MLLSDSKSTSESQNRVPSSQSDIAVILSEYLAGSPLIRHAQSWPSARYTFRKKERKKRNEGVVLSILLTKGDTRFRTTSQHLLGSPRTPQFAHLSILLRIDRAIREWSMMGVSTLPKHSCTARHTPRKRIAWAQQIKRSWLPMATFYLVDPKDPSHY